MVDNVEESSAATTTATSWTDNSDKRSNSRTMLGTPATGSKCFGKKDADDEDDDVNGYKRVPVVAARIIAATGGDVDGNHEGSIAVDADLVVVDAVMDDPKIKMSKPAYRFFVLLGLMLCIDVTLSPNAPLWRREKLHWWAGVAGSWNHQREPKRAASPRRAHDGKTAGTSDQLPDHSTVASF